jgi:hypothetical protein
MIRLFCGFDHRESIGFHVFASSVVQRSSVQVGIYALGSHNMPVGSNDFTYSRFLVPYLCGYQGHAIFADGADMLVRGDLAELDALFDPRFAVQMVLRPNYLTRNPRKYIGTPMESENRDYARKNWASVMLINCAHPYWKLLDPRTLASVAGLSLLQFGGLDFGGNKRMPEIGALPDRWNRIVDEGDSIEGAAILHWTAGIPGFDYYVDAPGADLWFAQRAEVLKAAAC